jgi:hypothetical protein
MHREKENGEGGGYTEREILTFRRNRKDAED